MTISERDWKRPAGATGLLPRQPLHRLPGEVSEVRPAFPQVRDDGAAHAGLPEPAQVVLDPRDRGVAVRLGAEEGFDVVGHLHQVLDAAAHSAPAYVTWLE